MESKPKKKILLFVDWFSPGFLAGGPIRSCVNLVEALRDDFDFSIVTRNVDHDSREPYPGIVSDTWTVRPGGVRISYLSSKNLSVPAILRILTQEQFDLFYLNSFFSFWFTIVPLILMRVFKARVPVLLAPRGMLFHWALRIKYAKKLLFIFLARLTGLYSRVVWHVTDAAEEEAVKKVFGGGAKVIRAINIVRGMEQGFLSREKEPGKVRLFFLSRISQEKNLLSAIQILEKLPPGVKIEYDIYGPVGDWAYWEKCVEASRKLPAHIQVAYRGVLSSGTMEGFRKYHFLFLPTLGENFGHVIVEAMDLGCPVIISDRTPWRGLEVQKAGWDISLSDEDKFVDVIHVCADMSQEEYDVWSRSAWDYVRQCDLTEFAIEQTREMFLALGADQSGRSCPRAHGYI